MKLFKKSTISLALASAMAGGALMGVSAPAQAVNIAHDSLGDAMVFPYYSTNAGWSTFFNITNTSDNTVVIKVRWREAHNSRDVRDFNVVMSPYDVWTAATVTRGEGAGMITDDTTCTFPQLSSRGFDADGKALTGIDFTDLAYTGPDDDSWAGTLSADVDTLSRTKEGYFEVFEMGIVDDTGNSENRTVAINAKHQPASASNNTAIPLNCNRVRNILRDDAANFKAGLLAPENNLKGRAVLINSGSGIAAGYDPLTLANFSNVENYQSPAQTTPNLAGPRPLSGSYVNDNTGMLSTVVPVNHPADVVSGLISRTAVINDYNIKKESQTDYVLTFPTKNFYVDGRTSTNAANFASGGLAASLPPFSTAVNGMLFGTTRPGKSCFDINISKWDREEFSSFEEQQDDFSPVRPGTSNQPELCYEANILSFGDSNLFDSQVRAVVGNLPGDYGWTRVTFGPATATGPAPSLPVIGMRVESRDKGDATKNFGFANDHAYERYAQ